MRKIEASFCKVDTFIHFFRIGDIANRTDFANVRIVRASAIAGGEMPNIKYIDNNEHKFSV